MPERPEEPSPDLVERAHLMDAHGFSPPLHRYAAPADLTEVIRRFWVPVWSLPPGEVSVQRVLQYPVCQVVVGPSYARLVGPHTGLATQELRDSGWVVGAMLQPAAGEPLLGAPVAELRDTHRDLTMTRFPAADDVVARIRDLMAGDPESEDRRREAVAVIAEALRSLLPVDEEGVLVNRIVEFVEEHDDVLRVDQLSERTGRSERSLQRLLARRVGLTPKWLIQRRRLHEVAGRLRAGAATGRRGDLARVAAELGYTDQAHLSRDFRAVTGLSPGTFAAEPRSE
ncbi:helix-turn-helix domain-containing protein [Nocardioides insulae]|uniref:helix-turn-helix domain-containing protein n=1 Tax=Nocardioides insulae TaxID=394734 RepID=UPI000416FE3C|nr:helix-turn-helix domain-containing protein [Nocardioides insulae]